MRLALLIVLGSAATALAQRPDSVTLWEYEDARGLHQVERLQDVPRKYRAKAREVTSSVVVGPAGRPPAPPAAAGSPDTPDAGLPDIPTPARPSVSPPRPPPPPAEPARYYCRWTVVVPRPRPCRKTADCGGAPCVRNVCELPAPPAPPPGAPTEGCYSDAADLRVVKSTCERLGRQQSAQAVTCLCYTTPSAVDERCR